MKKKFLAVLLAGVLTVGIPQAAFATGAETTDSETTTEESRIKTSTDGLWKYIIDEGKLILSSYLGDETEVVLPTEIDGQPVSAMGDIAFNGNEKVEKVTIPDNYQHIGRLAFSGCSNLTDVVLPNGLQEICDSTFSNCEKLKNINLPDSLTCIEEGAFANCTSLESIIIPDSVAEMGNVVFVNCTSLSKMTLSKSTKEYYETFSGCTALKEIIIPDGVTLLGSGMFCRCENLTDVTLPKTIKKIGDYAFTDCSNLKQIKFEGTKDEWNAIIYDDTLNGVELPIAEDEDFKNIEIICSDGTINGKTEPEDKPSSGSSSSGSSSSTTTTTPEPTEYTDGENETGVTASADEGVLPDGAELKVTPISDSANENQFTYDISFTDADGNEIQPNGNVTVKIPVPETFKDVVKIYVYRIETDGRYTHLEAEIKDGYIVFTTNHFSKYLVTTEEIKAETPAPETPKPTDTTPADTTTNPNTGVAVALIPVILAGAVVIVSAKKRK